MGLDNPLHIAFLVVILLLVFGARRLPEIGRSLGIGDARVQGLGDRRLQQSALPPRPQQQQAAAPAPAAAQPAAQPVAPPRRGDAGAR